jgi:hypothetical protein
MSVARRKLAPPAPETPEQTVEAAATVMAEMAARVIDAHPDDLPASLDAVFLAMAGPLGRLTVLQQRLCPFATRGEIVSRLIIEFARRMDAWAKTPLSLDRMH